MSAAAPRKKENVDCRILRNFSGSKPADAALVRRCEDLEGIATVHGRRPGLLQPWDACAEFPPGLEAGTQGHRRLPKHRSRHARSVPRLMGSDLPILGDRLKVLSRPRSR